MALAGLKLDDKAVQKAAAPVIRKQLAQEKNPNTQAALLLALAQLKDKKDEKTFSRMLQSSQSYTVQGAALQGLAEVQPKEALAQARRLQPDAKGLLTSAVANVYAEHGDATTWAYVRDQFDAAGPQGKFQMMESLLSFMTRLNDATVLKEGVERMQQMAVKYKQYGVDEPILGMLDKLRQAKPADQQPVVEQAMKTIMEAK